MFRFRAVPFALAALLAAGGAVAQQAPSHNPADVQSGTYKVDGNHTQIGFTILHMGFSNYSGRLNGVTGELTLTPDKPADSKLSVSVPAASFSTTSEKLDGELRGPDWFDAEKFPTITFVATKVTPKGKDGAVITGDLTLHGVTKAITLNAKLVGAGANPFSKAFTVGFDATGTVKRSEFGVTKYVPLIGDEVELTLHGAFEKI